MKDNHKIILEVKLFLKWYKLQNYKLLIKY